MTTTPAAAAAAAASAPQASKSTSRSNAMEVAVCAAIATYLLRECGVAASQIGIITPYGDQVRLLRESHPELVAAGVEVASVDSFQGREKEVVLLSLVRANLHGSVGFVEDAQRLNVAVTRARQRLVVIGSAKTLGGKANKTPELSALVNMARSAGKFLSLAQLAPLLKMDATATAASAAAAAAAAAAAKDA